jgi:hypothetical protein
MSRLKAQGTAISIGNGADPEVFTAIAGVQSYKWGRSRDMIDQTGLSDTYEQLVAGIRRFGELTMEIVLDPDDSGQAALLAADEDGDEHNTKVVASNGTRQVIIPCVVQNNEESGAVNDSHKTSYSCKIVGEPVLS